MAFVPPQEGTDEYEAWVDGPRPEMGEGRSAWLNAHKARKAERRRQGLDQGVDQGEGQGEGQGKGQGPSQGSDPDLAAMLLAVAQDKRAPHAAKVQAIRTIMEAQRGAAAIAVPSGTDEVDAMPTAQLRTLIDQLRMAHHWPAYPEAPTAQG